MSAPNQPYELAFYLNPRGAERRAAMQAIAEAGVRWIGTDGCTWHPDRDRAAIDGFRNDLRDFGLSIYSMHAIHPFLARADQDVPSDLMDALLTDLRRLALFGGKTAVYHACWMRDVPPERFDAAIEGVGWEAFVERYVRATRQVARRAAESDITVVIENVPYGVHAASVTGFIEIVEATAQAVGEPNVGICLDSGHTHLVGPDSGGPLRVADEVRAAGRWLRDTHFHDNVGLRNDVLFDQHIPPGLGTIDWQDVCRALREIAYPGPVVFEGVLGPGDSIAEGRFSGQLSYRDLIDITVRNWRAFESFGG